VTNKDKSSLLLERFGSKDAGVLSALFLAALVVRLPRLGSMDVWFDEVALLFQTKMSFAQIWTFCRDENFPPLYGWMLKAWGFIYTGDNWFRFLSTLLGAMIPPAGYILGRESHSRKLGLWLSLVLMFSLPLIFYSQNIRMYGLWVLTASVSYIGLIRALKTHEWKYWLLMAAANLVAFYTFLITIIFIASEILILVWHFRFNWNRYLRFLASHLPAILLMALWGATLLYRYEKVSEYVTWHMNFGNILDVWTYFGTGRALEYDNIFSVILNLPLIVGILVGVPRWKEHRHILNMAIIFVFGGVVITVLSIFGHSMFFPRYLLFLLPLYVLLSLFGWLELPWKRGRMLGISLISISALIALGIFEADYIRVNDDFRYVGQFRSTPGDDGRSLSRTARTIADRLMPGEVIVHYTRAHVRQRTFSFFTSIYYHNRSLPEYIYAAEPVPIYCGGQYVHPEERIGSLADLKNPPAGIWLITWDDPEIVDFTSPESKALRSHRAIWREDMPRELFEAGYRPHDSFTDYSLSAVHFLPLGNSEPENKISTP
jgi:hypothetical protein